jgi:hypothetical protein
MSKKEHVDAENKQLPDDRFHHYGDTSHFSLDPDSSLWNIFETPEIMTKQVTSTQEHVSCKETHGLLGQIFLELETLRNTLNFKFLVLSNRLSNIENITTQHTKQLDEIDKKLVQIQSSRKVA